MHVGILAVQGAVTEHIDIVQRTFAALNIGGTASPIRRPEELAVVDHLIIPGGESTTISRLMRKFDLFDPIRNRALDGSLAIMGTCAGCILLASESEQTTQRTRPDLLAVMAMAVNRNAFGRQRESFEHDVAIHGLDEPFHAVFIRAPIITDTWGGCEVLASIGDAIVMARQERLLAIAFHPELTPDLRIHELFLTL